MTLKEVRRCNQTGGNPDELVKTVGRTFRLPEIARVYFPEDEHGQLLREFQFAIQLLAPSQTSFYLSAENMLPMLNTESMQLPTCQLANVREPISTNTHDFEYRQRMMISDGPQFNMHVYLKKNGSVSGDDLAHVKDTFIGGLLADATEVAPQTFDLTSTNKRVFVLSEKHQIEIDTLGNGASPAAKRPIIIVEQVNQPEKYSNRPLYSYLKIDFVIDTKDEMAPVQEYSRLRKLFSLKLDWLYHTKRLTSWDQHGYATWVMDAEEPYVQLSDESYDVLTHPIKIGWWEYKPLLNHCAHSCDPGRSLSVEEERNARSYYFLELALNAAKMLHQAVVFESIVTNETVDDYLKPMGIRRVENTDDIFENSTKARLIHEFQQTGKVVTDGFRNTPDSGSFYTPYKYLLYQSIWKGDNIWDELHDITNLLLKAYLHNPERFWYYFFELGLDRIIPSFSNLSVDEKHQYVDHLSSSNNLTSLIHALDLLPDLSPSYDHRPGKEFSQSDDYFMELTLANAKYAYQTDEMPIAASIVTKEGRLVATLSNYGRESEGHAEARVINWTKKVLGPMELEGSKIFSTLGPCGGCINRIREGAKWITGVTYGLATSMMDFKAIRFRQDSIRGKRPHYRMYRRGSPLSQKLLSFYRSLEKLNGFRDLLPIGWYEDYLEKRLSRQPLPA